MKIEVYETKDEMARAAAENAGNALRKALENQERARFVAATGASQLEFLNYLTRAEGIDWSRTTMFHLDEYLGIPITHPASFRKYLKEVLVDKVHPGEVHLVDGEAGDPEAECERLSALIQQAPIDVSFIGIGENGHLAFNDPPADFETEKPYIVVQLDEACRMQQVNEGWYDSLADCPEKAISMSIRQIMKSKHIVCTVPDERKSQAVADCLSGDAAIAPERPASILKKHTNATVFLDKPAASKLNGE